jgi:molybdopterin-guanine dinucleotide biosynthesis protein A
VLDAARDGFAHPLSAVHARAVLPHIEALLAADRRRPAFLFDLAKPEGWRRPRSLQARSCGR